MVRSYGLAMRHRLFGFQIKLRFLTKKVKSNYFIVRPKVDQRAGILSLLHLGNFHRSPHLPLLRKHSPEGDTGAQRCALLVRLLTTHLPTPKGWKAELA